MPSTTLLDQLDDHLIRLLAVVDPDRVRSERPSDTAPIRMRRPNGSPHLPSTWLVTRQVRHLRGLGLVRRSGDAWSRTAAGDAYLAQHAGRAS